MISPDNGTDGETSSPEDAGTSSPNEGGSSVDPVGEDAGSMDPTVTRDGGASPGLLEAPDAVSAVAANATVGLEWTSVEGAESYNVYWSNDSAVTPRTGTLISGAERGYIHRKLQNGQPHYYIVTAVDETGESPPSEVVDATPGGEWVLEELGTGDFDDVLTGEPVPAVPIEERVHVLLFGEGYTEDILAQFHDHSDHDMGRDNDVDRWVDQVFSVDPYSEFREAFVVWYLPRASRTTIRAEVPDTAFQVPVDASDRFASMGNVQSDGETAQIAWEALDTHPFEPVAFDFSYRRARNFVAAFLIFDPERGRASVSGRATSLRNPLESGERLAAAFGVGHHHEFTHAFSSLRDEYMETSSPPPRSWSETSNVVGTNRCDELPWAHLLFGTPINPSTDGLVGAFGHPDRGFHSELLCLMNGTHENGEYFGDDGGGSCRPDRCTLRVEDRLCNFCREMTAYRIFERSGLLSGDSGFERWKTEYREAFYERFELHVPGVHYEGLLPQSNDRRNPEDGTQIFHACEP